MCASMKSREATASSKVALALFHSLLMNGWPAGSDQFLRSSATRSAYSGRVTRPVKFRSTDATWARLPGWMEMSQVSPPTSVPVSSVTAGVK
ncbi:hypothetical protein D9M69_721740 [compost metagenome]